MTNKEWDEIHKEVLQDPKVDKDFEKFLKRFYLNNTDKLNVLDIGCGQGANTAYTSYYYKDWICYACDFSSKALFFLNKALQHRKNVKIKQCNAYETGYKDEQFDLVFDVCMIASIDEPEKVIREIHRILKPKGKIFIKEISENECNNNNKYLRRGKEIRKYNEKQLYDLLSNNGFEKIEIYKSMIKDQNVENVVVIGRKK